MPAPVIFGTIGAFLASAIGPLAKKVLIALGIGTVTYTGLQAAFDAVQTQVIANYGQLNGAALSIADLAGVGQAIGIILGALAARVSIAVVSKLGMVL